MEMTVTKPEAQAMANQYQKPVYHVYVTDSNVGMRGHCEEQCTTTSKSEADTWAKQWRREYDKECGYNVKRATYQPHDITPVSEQWAPYMRTLHRIALANGKDWKFKLSCAWSTGRYWELKGISSNSDDSCSYLQSIRNAPGWGPGSDFWLSVSATPTGLEWKEGRKLRALAV